MKVTCVGTDPAGLYLGILLKRRDASHVVRGDTLEELAAALDERLGKLADSARNIRLHEEFTASLRGTIERFNGFACKGVDNDFRRGETHPGPCSG